ncbi:hypothetical protein DY360_001026 [Escherichia coli]|nr:hypothetical protein [Escherichia coli]EFB1306316.1 hypothetical protein [Escherichia coli]EFI4695739.1 hypothetical protein [Escherichia coli]
MFIPGIVVAVVIIFFIWAKLSPVSSKHTAELMKKKHLIHEAETIIKKLKGMSYDDMSSDQIAMYKCAIERLDYLNGLKPKHTPVESKLPQWPSNPNSF